MPKGLGHWFMDWQTDQLCSYFAQDDYSLVLAALSWPTGRKSMAMRKISTQSNQVSMLQGVPIRCPNPQPSVVKNWSEQLFFLEIPIVHIIFFRFPFPLLHCFRKYGSNLSVKYLRSDLKIELHIFEAIVEKGYIINIL